MTLGAQPSTATSSATSQRWDVFCRVVDNHGDLGVCWRLAGQLAARGLAVRLFVDDATALAWMAPEATAIATGVQVLPWAQAELPGAAPGDVVIETFGCDLPAPWAAAMQARHPPPVWVDLEYLSAEAYVERSHGLPSPRPIGLTTWFFYPGFTPRTGGLLREPGLLQAHDGFDGDAWLAAHGWARRPGERVVSLFCYDNPALPALLQRLAEQPTLLLLTPGHAQRLAAAAPAAGARCACRPCPGSRRRLRPVAAGLRCELRARRGFAGARRVGRAAVRLADLPAGRRRACSQAAGLRAARGAAAGRCRTAVGMERAGRQQPFGSNGKPRNSLLAARLARGAFLQLACTAWRSTLSAQPDLLTQLLRFVSGKALPGC